MKQLPITEDMASLPLTSEMWAFIGRHNVKLEVSQVFTHKSPMWAITSTAINFNNPKHVEVHNNILRVANGVI